jgi:hypothetical protein
MVVPVVPGETGDETTIHLTTVYVDDLSLGDVLSSAR